MDQEFCYKECLNHENYGKVKIWLFVILHEFVGNFCGCLIKSYGEKILGLTLCGGQNIKTNNTIES